MDVVMQERGASQLRPGAEAGTGFPVPSLRQSASGEILKANHALAALLGYESVEQLLLLTNRRVENLYVNPQDRGELVARLEGGSSSVGQEYALRSRSSAIVWVSDYTQSVAVTAARGVVYESILIDVTSRREREQRLLESENHYRLIAELAAEGVYVAQRGSLTWISDGLAELLGSRRAELTGRPLRELIAESSWPAIQIARRAQRLSGGEARFRASLLRQGDRRALPVEIRERETRTPHGPVTIGIIRDLTKQLEAEQSLAHDALHDPLTGLPNRKYFVEKLRERMEPLASRNNPFAVLFIDLDNFKLINDAHGHSAGDSFLLEVASRLRASLRNGDILARHGGDEFTVLLHNVSNLDEVVAITDRLQDGLAAKSLLDELGIYASSSIGIVMDHPGYQTPEEMLRDADTAMYHAKSKGRASSAVFDDTMLQAARSRLILESEVRHAYENEQFLNFYQPIFSRDGTCTGVEALIRWQHPQRGLLLPAQFLGTVEESTACVPISRKVLHDACRDLRRLLDDGCVNAEFTVSINVAERHILSGSLLDDLDDALNLHDLNKRQLILEIVENTLAGHPVVLEEIARLDRAGYVLSVDDFGVGSSSLSVIRDLPFDIVKLDQSFASRIEDSPRNAAFLGKILEIAHVLGLRTIAEGVQSTRQLEFLRGTGCSGMQGFLLARPMSLAMLRQFVETKKTP